MNVFGSFGWRTLSSMNRPEVDQRNGSFHLEWSAIMLVLSRKKNQQVLFPHLGIKVEILRVAGNTVSLGVEAPKSVQILRGELSSNDSVGDRPNDAQSDRGLSQLSRSALHQARNQLHQAQMIIALAQKQLESGQVENVDAVLDAMLRRLNELDNKTKSALPTASTDTSSSEAVSGKHALLVEDDANERTLLAAYLRLCGFKVTEAGDGVEAMAILAQQSVDLVVLDIHMPRMNGLETLQAMRCQSRLGQAKVVVVSGEDRDRVIQGEDMGAADVVSHWFAKPLNPVHLVHHLQSVEN